jgi:hypothetical protein
MQEMIYDIAKSIGCTLKSRFSISFAKFEQSLVVYSGKDKESENLDGQDLALHLIEIGQVKEGSELLDKMISETEDFDEKTRIHIMKLIHIKRTDGQDFLSSLEQAPPEYRESSTYKLWLGTSETNPIRAMKYLRSAIDGGLTGLWYRWALNDLARIEFELGYTKTSRNRLLFAIKSEDMHLISAASSQLFTLLDGKETLAKLFLACESVLVPDSQNLQQSAKFCWENKFASVGLYFASEYVKQHDNGESRLSRGLAREQGGMPSLAYKDFRIAANLGISVAKMNMAICLKLGAVAEAGLEILRNHQGEYDSDDRGAPYSIRAELEEQIGLEGKKEISLLELGRKISISFQRLLESAIRKPSEKSINSGKWNAISNSVTWELNFKDNSPSVTYNGKTIHLSSLEALPGIHFAYFENSTWFICTIGNEIEAITLNGFNESNSLSWLDFTLVDEGTELKTILEN